MASLPTGSVSVVKAAFLLVAWLALLGLLLDSRSNATVKQLQQDMVLMRRDLEAMQREVKQACTCGAAESIPLAHGPRRATVVPLRKAGEEGAVDDAFEEAFAEEAPPEAELPEAALSEAVPRAAPRRRGRRMAGIYTVGTSAAGVVCWSFTGGVTEADMNSDFCRKAPNQICTGCFIALDDNNDKVLEIIRCSNARYKPGDSISSLGDQTVEITIINADTNNQLTVVGCADTACSPAVSTWVMKGGDSVNAFCFTGGNNHIYFPNPDLLNTDTVSFAGKTVTDLGTALTVDIDGGTVDNVDIKVGSGKTLDLTGSTLVIDTGAISATKVGGGAFQVGTYSFGGSSITDGGTIQTVDIDGGTINNVDLTFPASRTLDVSAGTLSLADGQIPAAKVSQGTFVAGTYSFAGSTVTDAGTIATVDIDGGTLFNTQITGSSMVLSTGNTLDVSAGTLGLAGSQVPAAKVGPGKFGEGTYYFTGSTIGYTGIIAWADIDGGSIDGVNIGMTVRGYGLFSQIRTTQELIAADNPTSNAQTGTIFSVENPKLTAGSIESIEITNLLCSPFTPVHATAYPCDSGEIIVLDVKSQDNKLRIRVKNIGANDCTSIYAVHWVIWP